MDSLDELLADLHSATTSNPVKVEHSSPSPYPATASPLTYQVRFSPHDRRTGNGSPRQPYCMPGEYRLSGSNSSQSKRDSDRYSTGSGASGDGPAPPLPPPPSQDVLDEVCAGYHEEPLYEPQNLLVTNTSKQHTAPQYQQVDTDVGGQSTLGANLNELDYLLQDLNSAQFLDDINQSSSTPVDPPPTSYSRVPPPTLPKPTVKSQTSPAAVAGDDGHASSATRELEDLMDSLSQFKVTASSPAADDPAYAKVDKSPSTPSKSSELDNMLGNLESDMKGHGVSVATKGVCGACAKPVVGQVITALGQIWHPAHFCCGSCRSELGTRSFFERDSKPYCEDCYHRLFAPLCGRCNAPILDKCVTAMDTTFHMECFTCEHCGRMLNDEGFHEKDGKPYCRTDYFEMFAPKCGGCQQPIIEDFISTLNTQWHPHCFRCRECGVTLAGGSFYDHDGLPYCETHYYAKKGSLCAGCQKPITGRCITAMFRKFHPEHFTCAFCLKQLNKGTFKEQNDKPYCHPCFVKLFA